MPGKKYLALSLPLMRECFKVYWYIPVLSFVVYFFTGIFPLLSHLSNMASVDYYIKNSLSNTNFIYIALLCVVPILVAILMMGFLHNESKAVMLHSMPFSRDRIFNSYYTSGWIMCQLPVALMAVIYFIMSSETEMFSASDAGWWLVSSAAISTFFYGTAVLAGSLTGTTAMSLFTAGVMMMIIPVTVKIVNSYCQNFIEGYYKMPDWALAAAEKSNPLYLLLFGSDAMNGRMCIVYFATGLIISVIAKMIYKTRKLELVGESMLSKVFEEICTYLLVFVGMSVFGMFTWSFGESRLFIVIGMIAGALATFFVVKIVVNRSVKIMSRALIKSLIIYSCIAAVFIALTVFDISGSASKVPRADQVESVEIRSLISEYDDTIMAYGRVPAEYADTEPVLSSEESVGLVIELHEHIIDSKLYDMDEFEEGLTGQPPVIYDADGNQTYASCEYVTIVYNLKDGGRLSRSYDIYLDDTAAGLIDAIVTSDEYKEKTRITSYVNMDAISYITITGMAETEYYSDDYYYGDASMQYVANSGSIAVVENPEMIKKILTAWQEDVGRSGYLKDNRAVTPYSELATIEIYFEKGTKGESKKEKRRHKEADPVLMLSVTSIDAGTIDVLADNGYGQTVGVWENE